MLQKHLILIQFNLLQLTASICKDNFTQHVDGVLIARKQKFDDKRKLVLKIRPEFADKVGKTQLFSCKQAIKFSLLTNKLFYFP